MVSKFKSKLISFIANGDPILLNWHINPSLVKNGKPAVYIPSVNNNMTREELSDKGVLTPMKLR